MVQFPFQEWTDSSASMRSIIGGGKSKPYVLAKTKQPRLIHKNIKNKERTVIVKCFAKDTVCH